MRSKTFPKFLNLYPYCHVASTSTDFERFCGNSISRLKNSISWNVFDASSKGFNIERISNSYLRTRTLHLPAFNFFYPRWEKCAAIWEISGSMKRFGLQKTKSANILWFIVELLNSCLPFSFWPHCDLKFLYTLGIRIGRNTTYFDLH